MKNLKLIISGGGTGGHIYPAISIANAIKVKYPDADILFVGADNRMEMDKVPTAGYPIEGLPVSGFDRKNHIKNVWVLYRLYKSILKAIKIIRKFKPDVVIGVGGYASGPVLWAASQWNIPTLIQEQNSYAGITNQLLAKKATKICVAYEGMEKFFDPAKIVFTGNPIRQDLDISKDKKLEAYAYFGLDPDKETILVIGGSLGAYSLNKAMIAWLREIADAGYLQFIWQSGKHYYNLARVSLDEYPTAPIKLTEFISRMDLAYLVADLVVSRAGASSISELCYLGKPIILIPSPNVAENHQTKNAQILVRKKAAILVEDRNAPRELVPVIFRTMRNRKLRDELKYYIKKMALPNAANKIVDEIENMIRK